MTKMVKAKDREPISYELADWFWRYRTAEVIPYKAVEARMLEVMEDSGRLKPGKKHLTFHEVGIAISMVRLRMFVSHPGVTLINIRGIGYKVSNDSEYANYTMGWAKRTFNAAALTVAYAKGMKRECIAPALKKVFGSNEAEIRRLAQAKQEFAQEIKTWRKEISNGTAKE